MHSSLSSLRSNEYVKDPEKQNNARADEIRGGFVLSAKSDKLPARRNSVTDKSKKGFLSVSRQTTSLKDFNAVITLI